MLMDNIVNIHRLTRLRYNLYKQINLCVLKIESFVLYGFRVFDFSRVFIDVRGSGLFGCKALFSTIARIRLILI